MDELLQCNLKSIRVYLPKEEFQHLWGRGSLARAGKFGAQWMTKVMCSQIEPGKREAKTTHRHKAPIPDWFIAKKAFSSGEAEGINARVKLTARKPCGF